MATIESDGVRVRITASYETYEDAVGASLTLAAIDGGATTSTLQLEVRDCETLCTGGCDLALVVLQEHELDVTADGILETPSCWRCVDDAANEVGSCF